jgi:plasmid stabilization system protein ParE
VTTVYRVEYLPAALRDIVEIARYISGELGNPTAAERLVTQITDAVEQLPEHPFSWPIYHPLFAAKRPSLRHEYRKLLVGNYIVFYFVEAESQLITISNVIYGKSDLSLHLNND